MTKTAAQLAQGHYSHHSKDCFCGEGRWSRLPAYVKENFTCVCDQPYNENLISVAELTGDHRLSGSICKTCMLPQRFSVVTLLRECEGCDRYFIPEYTVTGIRGPALCSKCNVRPRFNRGKRRRMRIH